MTTNPSYLYAEEPQPATFGDESVRYPLAGRPPPVNQFGFPLPGEQSPSSDSTMNKYYFAGDAQWEEILDHGRFDDVVCGSGFCALAYIDKALKLDPHRKILLLERGGFGLPAHFQNLPLPFNILVNASSETYPWALSAETFKDHIRYVRGMFPFFGGRSPFWSSWSPRPPPQLLRDFPGSLVRAAGKKGFWDESVLKVVQPQDLANKEYKVLQAYIEEQFKKAGVRKREDFENHRVQGRGSLSYTDYGEAGNLAVGKVTGNSETVFEQFSTPGPLLKIYERQRELAKAGKGSPLVIATNAVVEKFDVDRHKRVTVLHTSRGALCFPVDKKTNIILATGAIPACAIVLNSLGKEQEGRAGSRLAGHFLTKIVARFPTQSGFNQFTKRAADRIALVRGRFQEGDTDEELGQLEKDALLLALDRLDKQFRKESGPERNEPLHLAAYYLAGQLGATAPRSQYHADIVAVHSPRPDEQREDMLRLCPDSFGAPSKAQLKGSEKHIIVACVMVGEISEDNKDCHIELDRTNRDVTTNIRAQVIMSKKDIDLRAKMHAVTLDAIKALSGGSQVEYWQESNQGGLTGEWTKTPPNVIQSQKKGVVNESSTLYVDDRVWTEAAKNALEEVKKKEPKAGVQELEEVKDALKDAREKELKAAAKELKETEKALEEAETELEEVDRALGAVDTALEGVSKRWPMPEHGWNEGDDLFWVARKALKGARETELKTAAKELGEAGTVLERAEGALEGAKKNILDEGNDAFGKAKEALEVADKALKVADNELEKARTEVLKKADEAREQADKEIEQKLQPGFSNLEADRAVISAAGYEDKKKVLERAKEVLERARDETLERVKGALGPGKSKKSEDDKKSTALHASVDRDYRVYGTSNVYATGSAIFPTAGSWNPTRLMCGYAWDLARKLSRARRPDVFQQVFSLSLASNLVRTKEGTVGQAWLRDSLPKLDTEWELEWGPTVSDGTAWYIAYHPSLEFEDGAVHPTYAIAISDTPPVEGDGHENLGALLAAIFGAPQEAANEASIKLGAAQAAHRVLENTLGFIRDHRTWRTRFIITGHSAGGAVAATVALALARAPEAPVVAAEGIFTYPTAAPLFGNKRFVDLFNETFKPDDSGRDDYKVWNLNSASESGTSRPRSADEAGRYRRWNLNLVNRRDIIPHTLGPGTLTEDLRNSLYGPLVPSSKDIKWPDTIYEPLPNQYFTGDLSPTLQQTEENIKYQHVQAYIRAIWDDLKSDRSQIYSTEISGKEAATETQFDFPLPE